MIGWFYKTLTNQRVGLVFQTDWKYRIEKMAPGTFDRKLELLSNEVKENYVPRPEAYSELFMVVWPDMNLSIRAFSHINGVLYTVYNRPFWNGSLFAKIWIWCLADKISWNSCWERKPWTAIQFKSWIWGSTDQSSTDLGGRSVISQIKIRSDHNFDSQTLPAELCNCLWSVNQRFRLNRSLDTMCTRKQMPWKQSILELEQPSTKFKIWKFKPRFSLQLI